MDKRRKVALIYEYNENWIGGTYYIQNLIAALNHLPDNKKLEIIVLGEDEKCLPRLTEITQYPYLSYRKIQTDIGILRRAVNKFGRLFFKKNIFCVSHKDLDVVFPFRDCEFFSKSRGLYWIPDFQEHYLPEFFSEAEVNGRKEYQSYIVDKANYIVFSSESAKADFDKFYPQNSIKKYLLPFAVSHPPNFYVSKEDILHKFKIPSEYFICSNQFWRHKNHQIVLEAVSLLKKQGRNIFVVFTGKEFDYRNPDYFSQIKCLAKDLVIEENICFLGFIDRNDQLKLMKNSLAVIQPSLFEGWSTVIEDAKALNVPIIASDISVHKEQLQDYPVKCLFLTDDTQSLVECILTRLENSDHYNNSDYPYKAKIREFAERFMNIVDEVACCH